MNGGFIRVCQRSIGLSEQSVVHRVESARIPPIVRSGELQYANAVRRVANRGSL